jgi:carbon-monoxide dehydrogenase large subunit
MVSDFGVVINPMLVEGQLHGGVVQGIGQALNEESVYDADNGQLITGSGMDYWTPRARELPNFDWAVNETRCETNPLGVKGCGESGPTAALPAVINAVVDALAPFGVTHIDMPATPERIWRAMNKGNA